jgi:hypothetical protein
MGATLHLLLAAAAPAWAGPASLRIAALTGLLFAGFGAFALALLALGVADWRDLLGRLRQPA